MSRGKAQFIELMGQNLWDHLMQNVIAVDNGREQWLKHICYYPAEWRREPAVAIMCKMANPMCNAQGEWLPWPDDSQAPRLPAREPFQTGKTIVTPKEAAR